MTTSLRDILTVLGFEENCQAMTDEQPGYVLDLGNIELTANQVVSPHAGPCFLFTGWARAARTLKEISFELPPEVDSFEQGVALIVRGIGYECEPETPTRWFAAGKKWRDRLPAPAC
jgi:hypothetical protein